MIYLLLKYIYMFLSTQCLKPEFKDGYKISAISEIADLFAGDLLLHTEKKYRLAKKMVSLLFH